MNVFYLFYYDSHFQKNPQLLYQLKMRNFTLVYKSPNNIEESFATHNVLLNKLSKQDRCSSFYKYVCRYMNEENE